MKKQQTYTFQQEVTCNMCGADSSRFKVLGKRLNKSQGLRPGRKTGITTTVNKCDNCGLIFANPRPIPASIDDHYGIDAKQYWKDDYFEIANDYFLGEVNWLQRLMPFQRDMKYLDIGAGIGKQMKVLEKVGFDTYGIEPSKPFRDLAISKMGISPERLLLTEIEEAQFEEETFDFISFGVVLEHLYEPSAALEKAMGWLKKGGLIHIEVPSADWLIHKLINFQYKIRGLDYVGNLSPMHVPYHLYEFSLKSFQENAKINGYKIRDHTYYVCDTFMPRIMDPIVKKYMKMSDSGMQLCIWLEK